MSKDIVTDIKSEENTKYKEGVNRNARLIVRNISFKATEESLREHFSPYGSVEEVKLLKKPDGRLVGCGFVHFTQVPMANKAIAATNKKQFLGRPLSVAWAVPRHKYDNEVQGDDTKMKSSGDEIVSIVKDEQSEENKAKKNKMRVNRNARLIIRNMSFKATEESLRQHFEPYGTILEVKLLKKPDGKLVGCAFVHFKNVPMAQKAILNTNMKPFLGRPISVDWAVAKDKYMQHVFNQQLEMQENVKKEESDNGDDDHIDHYDLNEEIVKKEESEDGHENVKEEDEKSDTESEDDEANSDDDDDSDEDQEMKEESDEEMDDEESDKGMDDEESEIGSQSNNKRIQLNDAEDGCTVFLTNVPFSVDNDQLREFVERIAPIRYALVCVDKLTEHSKGTAFVKFVNSKDAETFLSLPSNQLRLEGHTMQARPALKRDSLQKTKKAPKDNRNLYLVKEGVIVAGTKAAEGVSASDMSKRLALEHSKTQMLKNLNRFVSRYRLVVSNLPPHYDDAALRAVCARAAGRRACVTEARVMRDRRAPIGADGKNPSKGYGFVMFTRHEDALACLRKMNNNPEIFGKNNRPIVSFSIEDRTALNARKKRLEKSIANNPLANKNKENANSDAATASKKGRKRKHLAPPDESYVKKRRLDKHKKNDNDNAGENARFEDGDVYTGLTAKQGSHHKIRRNHKLKSQADIHRKQVKMEKKKSKRALRMKMAAKERIKLPRQKINKNKKK